MSNKPYLKKAIRKEVAFLTEWQNMHAVPRPYPAWFQPGVGKTWVHPDLRGKTVEEVYAILAAWDEEGEDQ